MKKLLFLAAAAMTSPTPATAAATLSDSIRADMPQLMTLYRDLHANPELSMQEVRTPAKLAPEMRKLGFAVTEHVGKTGVVAVMKNGAGPVLLIRADMDAFPVKEQTGLPFASKAMGKLPDGTDTPVMHACGHDTHITTWLATARRLAAMKDQWSGTVVMILQPGEERVMGAQAMLDDGLFTRFPKPGFAARLPRQRYPSRRHDRRRPTVLRSPTSIRSTSTCRASAATAPTRKHQGSDRPRVAHRHGASDPRQPREQSASTGRGHGRQLPFRDQEQHHPRRGEAALTVRSYTPETRKLLLDGIGGSPAARRSPPVCPTTGCRRSRSSSLRPTRPSTRRQLSDRSD